MSEPSVGDVHDIRSAYLEWPTDRGQFGIVNLSDTSHLRQATAVESRQP
jgi:hypothetical protein